MSISKEKIGMRLAVLATTAAAMLIVLVPSAAASQAIQSFEVHTTNTEAGAHPDLSASLMLGDAGQPEAADNIHVNLPEGVFGNPAILLPCSSAEFALNECAP